MKFQFIEAHHPEFRLTALCRVFRVSVSGFYAWRRKRETQHDQDDKTLLTEIKDIFNQHKGRYGAPRVHCELRERGRRCGKKRVARLMRQAGLKGKCRRKAVRTTDSKHVLPVAENLLLRNFYPLRPDRVWGSDITYIATKQGWLYLAITMDLYSRLVVGWAMDASMPAELPLSALKMAITRRNPGAGLIHHSDRGSQYASRVFQQELAAHHLVCSMSRKGDCWDNAVLESFFETLKRELVADTVFATQEEARQAIFEYVEVYYNRQRQHSALNYLTPTQMDRQAKAA